LALLVDGVCVRGHERLEFRRVPPPTKGEFDRNIHLHVLVLDGAYLVATEPPLFRRIALAAASVRGACFSNAWKPGFADRVPVI
jgi:hypothetical protein